MVPVWVLPGVGLTNELSRWPPKVFGLYQVLLFVYPVLWRFGKWIRPVQNSPLSFFLILGVLATTGFWCCFISL